MAKKIYITLVGIISGLIIGYFIIGYFPAFALHSTNKTFFPLDLGISDQQVIGFLPYWLLDRASKDYSNSITTLTYFGIGIDSDGSVLKLKTPSEAEPGWYALKSGKVNSPLQKAKTQKIKLSLLASTGSIKAIDSLMENPYPHAKNLIKDALPIMHQYGFTDLNLDIEYTQAASDEARTHFTQFIHEVKNDLGKNYTLTVEITANDLIHKTLIDPKAVGKTADYIVIMAYDFHSPDSHVTGPIAPLSGAGISSEYDVTTALQKAQKQIPSSKIILGIPLYGYEWETIGTSPRSAVIPGSGVLASSARSEKLLSLCASCSATFDSTAQEEFISYKDPQTSAYHQIFYPTLASTKAKIDLASRARIGGLALWALGYESDDLLNPLKNYIH